MRHRIAFLLLVALIAGPERGLFSALAGDKPAGTGLRIMSFNIRYGTARDGENHWEKRKDFVIDTIKAFDPDILGTQEALAFQRDYLKNRLPGYGVFGVGRDDGAEKGEMMVVFYRTNRLERVKGGHFWLSETPDRPGSKSWDSSLPRMATWLMFRDRRNPDEPGLHFCNTHFDHRGPTARRESARLLRRRFNRMDPATPVILTGDFNSAEGSAPYKEMFGPVGGKRSPLIDTFRTAHPKRTAGEGTFSGFGRSVREDRIDWIGCSRHWRIISADIDRTKREGRTPSDHYPVTAVLEQ